jgi:phenylacetic acid degradation operon negative regulatory protein
MIKNLHANGRLRVWSLIVTILGDVAQPRGGVISLADILTITGHMNIEAGAIRTALSRLAKEGWAVSEKTGRNSRYAFGAKGQKVFAPASDQIYASVQVDDVDEWVLAILPPNRAKERKVMQEVLADTNALQSTSGFALWPKNNAPNPEFLGNLECLCFDGGLQNVPAWFKTELAPPEAETATQAFIKNYTCLRNLPSNLPALDALVARILMLHDWRRLVLRYPILPPDLQPNQWPMPNAHALVAECYKNLAPVSEQHWSTPISPNGQAILAMRFNPNT